MRSSPSLPERHDVKLPAKVKRPWIKESSERGNEDHAQKEHQAYLPEAAEASRARALVVAMRPSVLSEDIRSRTAIVQH